MTKKITDMVPLETFDNEINIAIEGRIISFDQEANNKTHCITKEKLLPNKHASILAIIASAIDNVRNIKCKRPEFEAISVSKVRFKNCGHRQTETS